MKYPPGARLMHEPDELFDSQAPWPLPGDSLPMTADQAWRDACDEHAARMDDDEEDM